MGYGRSLHARVLSSLVACLLLVPLVPVSASAAGPPRGSAGPSLEFGAAPARVAGAGSVGTAIAISRRGWTKSRYVVLASAYDLKDQLLAASLAGTYGAPLLLTESTYLPSSVGAEIRRLGASRAFVVGGSRAVSYRVVRGLVRAGIQPTFLKRFGSADRYLTSRLVAGQIRAKTGRIDTVVMVNSAYPADALGVAALAGKYGMPILYTTRFTVPYQTQRALQTLKPAKAIVIGSSGVISGGQTWRIRALAGMAKSRMLRIAGSDVYDTAARIAEFSYANGFSYEKVVVANRYIYRDALAAGPWAARMGAPVVLTHPSTLPAATRAFFESHCTSIKDIIVIGSARMVAPRVLGAIQAASQTRIAEEVEVVTDVVEDSLLGVSGDGATLTFDASDPRLASLDASSVLVSGPTAAAPNGFLRRVVSVSSPSPFRAGEVSIETTEASLEDVIEKGSIDVTGQSPPDVADWGQGFTAQKATAIDPTHVDVAFAGFSSEAFGAPVAPAVHTLMAEAPGAFAPVVATTEPRTAGPARASIGSFSKSFTNVLYERNGLQVRTESSINIDASYVFNASFGIVGWTGGWISVPIYGLKSMKFVTYLSEGASVKLIAELDVAFTKEMELGRFRMATVNFMAGVVPVNICFYVVPIVGANATFHGKASAGVRQTLSISLGLEYDYRSGWNPIRSSTFGLSMIPPEAEASLSAKAWLGARVEAMFYDSFGPTLQPNAYLQFNADTTKNPWWWLNGGLEAKVGGRVDILGKNKTFSWGPYNLFDRRVANASGAFPSPSPVLAHPAVSVVPSTGDGASTASFGQTRWAAPPIILDPVTVEPGDFAIDGLAVTDASVQPDGSTVRLTTAAQTRDQTYDVAVAADSVKDQGGKGVLASNAGFLAYRPPRIAGAAAIDTSTVDVVFDAHTALDTSTVDAGDFTVPGLAVSGATVQPDGKTVRLTTADQSKGTTYTVSVPDGAVSDSIHPGEASSADFPGYWPVTLMGASAVDTTTVDAAFDSHTALDPATVQASDFAAPGLTVGAAALQPDGRTVRLTTSAQTRGAAYAVSVGAGDIADLDFANLAGASGFVGYWPITIASASGVDSRTVDVAVDSYAQLAGATVQTTDFELSGVTDPATSIAVGGATLQPDGRTVRLSTAPHYPGHTYQVGVAAGRVSDGTFANLDTAGHYAMGTPTYTYTYDNFGLSTSGYCVRFANALGGFIGAKDGYIRYTSNGGSTWVAKNLPVALPDGTKHVRDIAFPVSGSATSVQVVGWGGHTYTSTNAGTNWTPRTFGATHAWSIDYAGPTLGYRVGSGGYMDATANGGTSWSAHPQSGSVGASWLRFAPGGAVGYNIGGSTIRKSLDSGSTWSIQATGGQSLYGLEVYDDLTAWVVGAAGTIRHTSDGGATWVPQASGTTQNLKRVAFADRWHGFAVGDVNTVLVTWDGGATWSAQTSPISPALSPYFEGVDFSEPGKVWVTGWNPSSLPRCFKGAADMNAY